MLLTGLLQHQTGMGILGEDPSQAAACRRFARLHAFLERELCDHRPGAEVRRLSNLHGGKRHLGYHGEEKWPRQHGFDRYYGIIAGASSYRKPTAPRGLTLDNTPLPPPTDASYYTTDAFAEHMIEFIRGAKDDAPFFGYLALNSPHWLLHGRAEDIDKFVGKYMDGWDKLRDARWSKQLELGVVKEEWGLSLRDDGARPWEELTDEQKREMDYRMAVYAAQVHRMDYQIGRV